MPLDKEIRVRLVKRCIGVLHTEKGRKVIPPGEKFAVERNDGAIVWELDRECMIGDTTDNLCKLVSHDNVCVRSRCGQRMSGRVKVAALNFFIIKIRGRLGIGMGIRDGCGPTNQKGDGTVNMVEHSPSPTTDLNFLLIGNVEHRTVSIQTELESSSDRCRAFCWSTCEEPKSLLIGMYCMTEY